MRIISLLNLKGGVGKTTTVVNMAVILTKLYHQRVLVVDNDVQANASKFFDRHDYNMPSIVDVYLYHTESAGTMEVVRQTKIAGLDIIPSNLNLSVAVDEMVKDSEREQNTRLRSALQQVEKDYDFCIIDNPPGIGMNVINALTCTHDVIVPVKIDKAAMDGMEELADIVGDIAEYNPLISSMRILVTMFYKEMLPGEIVLNRSPYDMFRQHIRYSKKVDVASFEKGSGLLMSSPRSAACVDYRRFVAEYVETLPEGLREGVVCHA